jgi:hypothetical protein
MPGWWLSLGLVDYDHPSAFCSLPSIKTVGFLSPCNLVFRLTIFDSRITACIMSQRYLDWNRLGCFQGRIASNMPQASILSYPGQLEFLEIWMPAGALSESAFIWPFFHPSSSSFLSLYEHVYRDSYLIHILPVCPVQVRVYRHKWGSAHDQRLRLNGRTARTIVFSWSCFLLQTSRTNFLSL